MMTKKLMILLITAVTIILLSFFQGTGRAANGRSTQTTSPIFLPDEGNNHVSSMAVDAAGGIHISYKSQYAVGGITPIYYAYCAANCNLPANWTAVTVGDANLGAAAVLALTPAGQPRLLWTYQQTALGDSDYVYAACDSNCLNAGSWSQITVATTASSSRRNLTLTPQGQPRFVYTDISSYPPHSGLFYVYCDANCAVLTNWSEAQISTATTFYDINLTADAAGKLHLLYNFNNSAAEYAQCASDCANPLNWNGVQLYTIGVNADLSLAITDNNQPRFAVYTGSVDNQTYYAWCDAACGSASGNWQRSAVGLADFEGKELALVLDNDNQPHLLYHSQNLSLGYAACTADCDSAQSAWTYEYVETAAQLNALEPAPPGCTLSSWDAGGLPSAAVNATGTLFVSYDAAQMLAGCTDVKKVRFAVVGGTGSFSVYLPAIIR